MNKKLVNDGRQISGYVPQEKTGQEKVDYYLKEVRTLENRLASAKKVLAKAQGEEAPVNYGPPLDICTDCLQGDIAEKDAVGASYTIVIDQECRSMRHEGDVELND